MNSAMILAHSARTEGLMSQDWNIGNAFYLAVPLAVYAIISLGLFATGNSSSSNLFTFFFGSIANSLRRATGYPGWAMGGVLSALLILWIAVFGFYWDVAWHIDNGRDDALFTPSHVMILVGLGGLIYAAAIAVIMATVDKVKVGFRFLGLQIPWSALAMGACGAGGLAAFPLDVLWHESYGIDVTLWSPSHLQLLAGGGLSTIACWLMIAEARRDAHPTLLGRGIHALVAGAVLVALSTFQGEFDYGVPQFQLSYHPILIAAAGALALTAARLVLGKWGAFKAVTAFLILRTIIGLLVTGTLDHTFPRFPSYIFMAAAVEAAAALAGTKRRLPFALAAGGLAGTAGVAAESALIVLGRWMPPRALYSPKALALSLVAGVSAAVLGAALARAFRNNDDEPVGLAPIALAAVGLLVAFWVPLPRNTADVEAVIRLQRDGHHAKVEAILDPPDAAEGAEAFVAKSWQGGGTVTGLMTKVGPGRYVSDEYMPVTKDWKTTLSLNRGDEVLAAPVYLPADPEIGASAVEALPERKTPFFKNIKVLLREAHGGPAWPSIAAFTGLGLLIAIWSGLFGYTALKTSQDDTEVDSPTQTAAGAGGFYPQGTAYSPPSPGA